jgi:flagellar FliL protein
MASPKPNRTGTLIKNTLLLLVVIAASIGGTLLYSSKFGEPADAAVAKAQQAPKPIKPAIPSPIYVALDPFTVTLQDNYSRRILYTGITLRVADERSSSLLARYMPEVRSRTLLTLSEQNPQTVQTPQGRAALAKALIAALEAPYLPNPDGPKISNVLFTAFVVQ